MKINEPDRYKSIGEKRNIEDLEAEIFQEVNLSSSPMPDETTIIYSVKRGGSKTMEGR